MLLGVQPFLGGQTVRKVRSGIGGTCPLGGGTGGGDRLDDGHVERRQLGRGPLVAVGAAHREHGGDHGVDAVLGERLERGHRAALVGAQ